jgi:hypothetical protein
VSPLGRWTAGAVLGAVIFAACQERLTAPGQCPELCPGGSAQAIDTVVPAVAGRDSSFPSAADAANGYVGRGGGDALLLSNGFAASEDRPVYRFAPRSDLIKVRDTLRTYTIDSAQIALTIAARDTLVGGLHLYLYRLPSSVDSTATFSSIDPLLVEANLIDSIVVPDSQHTGIVRSSFIGDKLARIALVSPDSTLAIGLRMAAVAPTGIRLGALHAGTAATFTTWVNVDVPDTGSIKHQTMSRSTVFNTFVTENPIVPVDSLLTVGGEPSSRALVRFGLSDQFLDSVKIVRATLEMTPVNPIISLPNDPSLLVTKAVVGDIGAKSPASDATGVPDTLAAVQSDTVGVEITRIVKLWQSNRNLPQSVFVQMFPEAATFARAVFFSTRSHGPDPSAQVAPRLRITYQRSFPFENP